MSCPVLQVIAQSVQHALASLPVVLAPLLNVFPLQVKVLQDWAVAKEARDDSRNSATRWQPVMLPRSFAATIDKTHALVEQRA